MSNTTIHVESICDDNGVELLVAADVEQSGSQIEFCHGPHEVGYGLYVELTSVEVVIGGEGIEILPKLTKKQKGFIIDKLNIE